MKGIKVSDITFLGEGIEIEPGFLEATIDDAKKWLPSLEKTVNEKGLLHK
jgi:hypothetical protein